MTTHFRMLHMPWINWILAPSPSRRAWNWKDRFFHGVAIVWLMCLHMHIFKTCETSDMLMYTCLFIALKIHYIYTYKREPLNEFAILTEKLNTFKKWKTFKRNKHAEEIGKTQTTTMRRRAQATKKKKYSTTIVWLYLYIHAVE